MTGFLQRNILFVRGSGDRGGICMVTLAFYLMITLDEMKGDMPQCDWHM